jgi:AraC-like DNA-binding protein
MAVMLFDSVWTERVHRSAGCELLHVIRGRIRLELGAMACEAGPGDTLLVPPNTLHRDRFDLDRGLEVFYCSLDWPWLPGDFGATGNAALLRLPAHRKAEIGVLIHQLAADVGSTAEWDRLVAQTRLLAILTLLLGATATAKTASPSDTLPPAHSRTRRRGLAQEARAYLERNYARPLTLGSVAAALGISPCHLSRVFRAESGFPLFSHLAALRMDQARLLLLDRHHTVAEVAHAVGYADPHHFAKVFRRHAGCAPRDYAARTPAPHNG